MQFNYLKKIVQFEKRKIEKNLQRSMKIQWNSSSSSVIRWSRRNSCHLCAFRFVYLVIVLGSSTNRHQGKWPGSGQMGPRTNRPAYNWAEQIISEQVWAKDMMKTTVLRSSVKHFISCYLLFHFVVR